MLVRGQLVGVALQTAAMITLAAGINRRPRTRSKARIRVDDRTLYANDQPLAALVDIAGLSVAGTEQARVLTVTTRTGRRLGLAVETGTHIAELRAALGLGLARDASYSYEAHAALGCVSVLVVFTVSIGALMRLVTAHEAPGTLVVGLVAPMIITGVPMLFARLRGVTITCGDEGVHVQRRLGRTLGGGRLLRYEAIEKLEMPIYNVIAVTVKGKRKAYELGSAEDARLLRDDIASRARLPRAASDADVNVSSLLARGTLATEQWLTAIRNQNAPDFDAYRSARVPEDRLWSVLEDPGADPTARVGAALALRTQTAGGVRVADVEQRLRVAASATALPEVRDAVLHIADEPDDERVLAKITRALR